MVYKTWLKKIVIISTMLLLVACTDEPKTFVQKYVKACTKSDRDNTPQLCECTAKYIESKLQLHPKKEYFLDLIIKSPRNPKLQEILPLFSQAAISCYIQQR